ncbi:DUF3850 domain-containing protein [Alicyclobacillus curvatus]|jgi:hypothetical protein|nr:DUF3850 domain-containing protein [Alicyclobacillus curvatus]
MEMVYIVKVTPDNFESVRAGNKTVEMRKDDKGYRIGDKLILTEYNTGTETYTGRACVVTVTHILRGEPWMMAGYVALSIKSDARVASEQIAAAAKVWRAGLAERARCQGASEHDRDETYRKNLQAAVALTNAVDALKALEQENIKIVRVRTV